MTSRYNNNDGGTPLLVCPRRAPVKMEQTYAVIVIYSFTFAKPVLTGGTHHLYPYCFELIIVRSIREQENAIDVFTPAGDTLKNDFRNFVKFLKVSILNVYKSVSKVS